MGEINLGYQVSTFLLSVILGVLLCIIYDFIRIFHKHYRKNGVLIIAVDIFYFILAAIITYSFLLLRCLGNIRFFVFVGGIIGFFLFRKFLSDYLIKTVEFVIKISKKIYGFLKAPIVFVFTMLAKFFSVLLKYIKNIAKWLKKHLKQFLNVLYNFFKVSRKKTIKEEKGTS